MTHSGTDRHRSLSITVDKNRQVTGVEVLDLGHLRDCAAFIDAVEEAFAVADGERILAALEALGDVDEYLVRAEATVSGRSPAQLPPRPDVSRTASAVRRAAGVMVAPRAETPLPGTSDNGYLTVHRRSDGRLLRVEVDAEWLGGARQHHLEQAVLQAFRVGTETPS
jgi:hypothetical protein